MKWVFNRKIYAPFQFVGGVVVNVVNMAIMMIVLDMFLRVDKAKNLDWYHTALNQYSASDSFIHEKMDVIFVTLALVIFLITVACVMIFWMFRTRQCHVVESQIGIFRACGYPMEKLFFYLFMDGVLDIILAALCSFGVFRMIFVQMIKIEAFSSIYRITGYGWFASAIALFVTVLIFLVVLILQIKVWLSKQEKKGIVAAIKQK